MLVRVTEDRLESTNHQPLRSQRETRRGCIVSCTAASKSARIASRSTSFLRRSENASTVLAESYLRRSKRLSMKLWRRRFRGRNSAGDCKRRGHNDNLWKVCGARAEDERLSAQDQDRIGGR
jgi:hypothetical protein